MNIKFLNTYADLGEAFSQSLQASCPSDPKLRCFNDDLALSLGLDLSGTSLQDRAELFSGKKIHSSSQPVAMAYAGHQFGHFVPQLGDGRAMLLGEVEASSQRRYDIHLKGSGKTRFSRGGDGYATLGSAVREYLVSEAMHALGVPSSRALALVETGDLVYREKAFPGAVLARVASSHIRVGTFEYFYAKQDHKNLKILADYVIKRYYTDVLDQKDQYVQFFLRVAKKQLTLVAKWMSLGFIHGVMNTDNTSIVGETLDFGPCAFMDTFSHDKVFSAIDRFGRYRYDQQGEIALWNLSSFASCLTVLCEGDQESIVKRFEDEIQNLSHFFKQTKTQLMVNKLGIFKADQGDEQLVDDFLNYLQEQKLDFSISFRHIPEQLKHPTGIYKQIKKRLESQEQTLDESISLMKRVNPSIIPRNHLVEKAIQNCYANDDSFFKSFAQALQSPYDDNIKHKVFSQAPNPDEIVHQTFCGT